MFYSVFLDATFEAKKFIHFDEKNTKQPHKELYKHAINSTNIVLAKIDQLYKLKK